MVADPRQAVLWSLVCSVGEIDLDGILLLGLALVFPVLIALIFVLGIIEVDAEELGEACV